MTFEIWTRDLCPWCVRAKRLIESKGFAYREVAASEMAEEDRLAFKAKYSTYPQVFHEGERIGGYEALEAWFTQLATR